MATAMTNDQQVQSDVREWVLSAEDRIREHILETPLEYSHHLSEMIDIGLLRITFAPVIRMTAHSGASGHLFR